MPDSYRNLDLFALEHQIGDALALMEQTIIALDDAPLSRDRYLEYQLRFSRIQYLFDLAAERIKSADLTQENPELYRLLESKQNIALFYGQFRRLQNGFQHRYTRGEQGRGEELTREHVRCVQEDLDPGADVEPDIPADEPAPTEDITLEMQEAAQTQQRKRTRRRRQAKRQADYQTQMEATQQTRRSQEEFQHGDSSSASIPSVPTNADSFCQTSQQDASGRYDPEPAAYPAQPDAFPPSQPAPYIPYTPQPPEGPAPAEYTATDYTPAHHACIPPHSADHYHDEPTGPQPQMETHVQLRQEQAERLSMHPDQRAPVSEADLRTERFRQEDARQAEEHAAQVRSDHARELLTQQQHRQAASDSFTLDSKGHMDFSAMGQYAPHRTEDIPTSTGDGESAHDAIQVFQYTPGGVVASQIHQQAFSRVVRDSAALSSDNHHIYEAIRAMPETPGKPNSISPAYESQMRFNLELARIAYQEARGTPAAKEATHAYLSQRCAYMKLRSDIKEGIIQLEQPKVMATDAATFQPKSTVTPAAFYQYTPSGIQGQLLSNARLTGTQYTASHPGERKNFRYTAANPLIVSPAYESALRERVAQTSALMDTAVGVSTRRHATMRLNPMANSEVTMATTAYIGFLRAKQAGQVVVQDNAKQHTPDFEMWSQRYHTIQPRQNRRPQTDGQTVQTPGTNPNRPKKAEVEEKSSSILGKSAKLKREGVIARYGKTIGYKLEGYSSIALSRMSRKMYQMMQCGNDDAAASIQTFERGRYYAASAYAIGSAIKNFHVVDSRHASKVAQKMERHQYGKFHYMSKKELRDHIRENKQTGRQLKKEIQALKSKGSALTKEQRKELRSKMRELSKTSRETKLAISFRNLQRKGKLNTDAAEHLEGTRRVMTSRKHIDETISKLRKAHAKKMEAKFGKLQSVSNKSLKRSIDLMTAQGRQLKEKIKLLQGKGALLSPAERKQLLQLMKQHKALSADLRKYIGLREARKELQDVLAPYMAMRRRIFKNAAGWSSGLYALYGFILRPIREGSETGALGLAKFADISTNRYVHRLVKKIIKWEYKAASWIFEKTGLKKLTQKAAHATAKAVMKTAPAKAIKAGTQASRAAVRTAVNSTKSAISRMTPKFVKTGISKTMHARALLSSTINRGKAYIARSTVGRAVSAVYRTYSKITSAIRTAVSAVKGFLIKGILIILAAIVVFGLMVGVVEILTTTVSSVIMATDTVDDKIDLSPYFEIINDLDEEFNEKINSLKTARSYDNVYVNYTSSTMNNSKEMLSMMAVRMNQELDLSKNTQIELYLRRLYEDSHLLTTKKKDYSCSGCKTRTETVEVTDPDTGEVTEVEREVTYCPGHTDLYINITVLGFDALFTENCGEGGEDGVRMPAEVGEEGTLIADDFIITHYCACEICCGPNASGLTSSGTKPKEGRTIATDPSVIPSGARVIIEGYDTVFVAEDTGGAIDGHRIDIYMDDHHEALMAGEKYHVSVYWSSNDTQGGDSATEDTPNANSSGWTGWTEDNIAWCKAIYIQDWSELYAGAGVAGFATPVTDEELVAILDNLPADLSEQRRNIIEAGLSGIGRISYHWGGKPTGPGLSGIPSSGLDCSGFITWCYLTAGIPTQDWYYGGTGMINGSSSMIQISHSDLKPGDLGFKHTGGSSSSSNANHVGIYIGKNANGKDVWLHCASGSGATINTYGGFTVYYRSTAFN